MFEIFHLYAPDLGHGLDHSPVAGRSGSKSCHRGWISCRVGTGRLLLRLMAFGLLGAGCFALVQSATGRFLPHDLRYLEMNVVQLCGLGEGRIARFMFHDRVAFGGALVSIGVIYLWLEQIPLKAGESWAWRTFLLTGITGFGSFFAYLGYGYLDLLHTIATLTLLPLYLGGLMATRVPFSERHIPRVPAAVAGSRMRFNMGRGLLLTTALGLIVGGVTILLIGMTRVFVPQDLGYLRLGASDLIAMNRRLIPIIAHDRDAFGGAIATCGLLMFCCLWFGRPSRSLWHAVGLAGGTGFVTAIGVHPLIGYTSFSHLAPAYGGALIFVVGMFLCHKAMSQVSTI